MRDKEMIEEMAKAISDTWLVDLPEDSVVLSKEEYEKVVKYLKEYKDKLSNFPNEVNALVNMYNKGCKETAEKFARDIFNHITTPEVWEKLRQLWLSKDGNFNANKHIYDLLIEPIAKTFDVEIKE